jgi:hypothetical protein
MILNVIRGNFGVGGGRLALRAGIFSSHGDDNDIGDKFLPRVRAAISRSWDLCHSKNCEGTNAMLPYFTATKLVMRMLGINSESSVGSRIQKKMGVANISSSIVQALRIAARDG